MELGMKSGAQLLYQLLLTTGKNRLNHEYVSLKEEACEVKVIRRDVEQLVRMDKRNKKIKWTHEAEI